MESRHPMTQMDSELKRIRLRHESPAQVNLISQHKACQTLPPPFHSLPSSTSIRRSLTLPLVGRELQLVTGPEPPSPRYPPRAIRWVNDRSLRTGSVARFH